MLKNVQNLARLQLGSLFDRKAHSIRTLCREPKPDLNTAVKLLRSVNKRKRHLLSQPDSDGCPPLYHALLSMRTRPEEAYFVRQLCIAIDRHHAPFETMDMADAMLALCDDMNFADLTMVRPVAQNILDLGALNGAVTQSFDNMQSGKLTPATSTQPLLRSQTGTDTTSPPPAPLRLADYKSLERD